MFNSKETKKVVEPPIIMDTSALIDGRVLAVAKTGFMPSKLIVSHFVITELQQLADGSNSYKRERARYGMDVIKELQEIRNIQLVIDRGKFPNIEQVDDKLVALAKQEKGYLFTTDYNLGKVAEIEGIKVLNVNELAQSLRPVILPGEILELKIVQKGSERGQGVAYLDDGTMVVVENGAKYYGSKVKLEFSRSLQTMAGKMMFATLAAGSSSPTVQRTQETKPQIKEQTPSTPRPSDSRQHSSSPKPPKKQNYSQSSSKSHPQKNYPNRSNMNRQRSQSQRRKHPEDKLMDALNEEANSSKN